MNFYLQVNACLLTDNQEAIQDLREKNEKREAKEEKKRKSE